MLWRGIAEDTNAGNKLISGKAIDDVVKVESEVANVIDNCEFHFCEHKVIDAVIDSCQRISSVEWRKKQRLMARQESENRERAITSYVSGLRSDEQKVELQLGRVNPIRFVRSVELNCVVKHIIC